MASLLPSRCRIAGALALVLGGCLEYEAENPFDPSRNGGQDAFVLSVVADTGRLRLSWNMVEVAGFDKYVLRRSADSGIAPEPYREFAGRESVTYIDEGVSPDSTYHYVIALVAEGKTSRPSSQVAAKPLDGRRARLELAADTLPFGSDKNAVEGVIRNSGLAPLQWRLALPGEPWLEYSGPTEGRLVPDSSVSLPFRIARAKFPKPGTYRQSVPVLSKEGGDRAFVLAITVPDPSPPGNPILSLGDRKSTSLQLRWSRCLEEDFSSYDLYRGSSDQVDDRDIRVFTSKSVTDTLFTDTGLTSLRTYHYRAYVSDRDGLRSSSNAVQAGTTALRTLTVSVRHALRDSGLPGVNIRWMGTGDSGISDGTGSAVFQNLKPGPANLLAVRSGFFSRTDSLSIREAGEDSIRISLLPIPASRRIGTTINFTDLFEAAFDGRFAYALERDWLAPRLVVIDALTGNEAASVGLKSSCSEILADILAVGPDVYVSCPAERKLIRVRNALGTAEIKVLDLPFDPFGLAPWKSGVLLAGKAMGDSGVLGNVDTADFTLSGATYIAGFGSAYNATNTRGPRVAVLGDTAYVTNASSNLGRVASIDLGAGKVLATVLLPWGQATDIAVADGRILVSGMASGSDSVVRLDRALVRLPSLPSGSPVLNLDAVSRGHFSSYIPMVLSGAESHIVRFADPAHPILSGEMEFASSVWSWKTSPDGGSALVTSADGVFVVEFR